MLKLTRKLEYALIALRHMQTKGELLSSTKEISDLYTIPQELLAKTLQQMARLNILMLSRDLMVGTAFIAQCQKLV